jgi:hypothetical protein
MRLELLHVGELDGFQEELLCAIFQAPGIFGKAVQSLAQNGREAKQIAWKGGNKNPLLAPLWFLRSETSDHITPRTQQTCQRSLLPQGKDPVS